VFFPLPDQRSSSAIMCGKFESRFKQCDESSVNDFNSRAPGKLRLSTQVPCLKGFPAFDHVPLTVAILSPLTIAAGRSHRRVNK
jgi:hypothetical protein